MQYDFMKKFPIVQNNSKGLKIDPLKESEPKRKSRIYT